MNTNHFTEGSFSSPDLIRQNGKATPAHLSTVPVCIISDSCLLREGLAQLIAPHLKLQILHVAPSEPVNLSGLPPVRGQVVVIDCAIGQTATMNWIEHCRSLSPSVYILLLQAPDDVEMILRAIEAGANSYALQGASTEDIAHIIRVTHEGGAVCSPQMTAQLFARLATRAQNVPEKDNESPLTPREKQVLGFIARGYSNKEIAIRIVVTVRTVKHHVHNILHKLDVSNRHAAVKRARAEQWLEQ